MLASSASLFWFKIVFYFVYWIYCIYFESKSLLPFPSYGKCACRSFYGKIIQTCTVKHFISGVCFQQTTRKWCKYCAMQQSPVCIGSVILVAKARQIQSYKVTQIVLRVLYLYICIRKTEVADFLKSKWGILWLKTIYSMYILSVTAFWNIFVLATFTQRQRSRFRWIVTIHYLWRKTVPSVLLHCIVFEVLHGIWEMLGCICKRTMLSILLFWALLFLV